MTEDGVLFALALRKGKLPVAPAQKNGTSHPGTITACSCSSVGVGHDGCDADGMNTLLISKSQLLTDALPTSYLLRSFFLHLLLWCFWALVGVIYTNNLVLSVEKSFILGTLSCYESLHYLWLAESRSFSVLRQRMTLLYEYK